MNFSACDVLLSSKRLQEQDPAFYMDADPVRFPVHDDGALIPARGVTDTTTVPVAFQDRLS